MSAKVDQILNEITSLSEAEVEELKRRMPDDLILSDWEKLSRSVLEKRRQAGLPPPTHEEVMEECRRARDEVTEFLETEEYKWPTNIDEVIKLGERIKAKYKNQRRA